MSLSIENVNYQFANGLHYYYHTRVFRESNGVGITLNRGQLCYQSTGGCNSANVNYRVNPNDQFILGNQNFNTPNTPDRFTISYSGTDDNGNQKSVEESFNHPQN